jgi:hypothetical protein
MLLMQITSTSQVLYFIRRCELCHCHLLVGSLAQLMQNDYWNLGEDQHMLNGSDQ